MERLRPKQVARVLFPITTLTIAAISGWSMVEAEAHTPRVVAEGQDVDLMAQCVGGDLGETSEYGMATRVDTGFTAYARWKGDFRGWQEFQKDIIEKRMAFDWTGGLNVESGVGVINNISVETPRDRLSAQVFCPARIPRLLVLMFGSSK